MRDVELVETDDARTPAAERAPSFLDRARRRPRWIAAGAAVVVALVGYQLVSDRRLRAQDDARAAALADLPYVLDRVDPSFPVFLQGTYSWDDEGIEPVAAAYLGRGVPVDGILVAGAPGARAGEARLVGVDEATADVVWQTVLQAPQPGATQADAWCGDPGTSGGTTARCVVRWQLPPEPGPASDALWVDVAVMVEVDGASGSVLRRTDVPAGAVLGTGSWGTVVGTRDGARVTLDAAEWDGTHRWTRTLDLQDADDETYLTIALVEDRVLLADASDYSGWVLSADDGTTLTTLEGTPGGWGGATLLPGGGVVVADPSLAGDEPTGDPAAMLVRPDGTEVPFDGDHQEWVSLDDGTLGDALLTGSAAAQVFTRTRAGVAVPDDEPDGSAVRLREPDGSVRWEVAGLDVRTAIAVDGLVVARTADEVVAVDARTGRVRWRVEVPSEGSSMYQLLTDGRVILASRGAQLDALSFRGDRLWSAHAEDAGEEHVVVPGPARTPAPTETGTPTESLAGDDLVWSATVTGRLLLGVTDPLAGRREYVVFGR